MSGPLPQPGYIQDPARTTSDMQTALETENSVALETIGGAPEGAILSISSNIVSPPNYACVFPVDATGGGTIDLIDITNMRDGQVLTLHCTSASNPISIANGASGSGSNVPIATFSGANVVLSDPAQFLQLKYNQSLNLFQEFMTTNWSNPGPIGSVSPNSGAFTSLTISAPLAVSSGGTGMSSFTAHSLVVGEGTSLSTIPPSSTSGYPLLSNGSSSDPSFGQLNLSSAVTGILPVSNGGTGSNSFAAHNLLVGEGATLSTIAPSTASGYPLVSNGSTSDPAFAQLDLTSAVTGSLPVANGGTGATILTAHGVLIGEDTGAVVAVAPSSTSGYPLLSNGSSSDPAFGPLDLTSAVTGTLPITNGGTGTTSFSVHQLLVGEGTSLSTIAPSSEIGYPLVSKGSASDPAFAQLDLTSAVTGTLPVTNGGTGATSFTAHGVLIGENTGAVVAVAPSSTSGYPLLSYGSSSDPAFAALNLASAVTGTLPVTNGGSGGTSFTAHGVLIGEDSGAFVAVAPSSISGYPLVSNGSSSDPAFAQLNLATATTGTLPVTSGGTGATSFTAHGVLVGESTGSLVAVAPSNTIGLPLLSNGSSADPSFGALNLSTVVTGTLPIANGGTGATSFASHALIVGEGSSLASIAPSSISGYVLVSNGSSSDPSFAQLNLGTATTGTLSVANGGTGATNLSAHGVLIGEGTGAVVSVAPSITSGYPLLSNGSSSDPAFNQLNLATAVIGTLPVTNGGTGATSFSPHNILVGEGTSLSSIAPSSTSGYVLVSNGSSLDPSFAQLNLGTATTGTLPVANGGTGAINLTAHGVLIGEGTGAVVSVAPSANTGYPLISNGSALDPSFGQLNLATAATGTLPVANGGTGATSFNSHSILVGEGSSLSTIAPSSTSGFPLVSNGSSADPSFAPLNLSAGVTGTLPVSNGGTGLSTLGTANQVLATNSTGTALQWTNAASPNFPLVNQCRLYLSSALSNPEAPYSDNSSGSSTIYFGPCPDKGNSIYLYSSSAWGLVPCTETSYSISSEPDGVYDIYVYNNSGSVAIDTPYSWGGNTPPGRGVQDGVLTKNGDPTRLYVGSIEVYSGKSYSWSGNRGVWNACNRIESAVGAIDTTTSWSYSGSWRIAHGVTAGFTSYGTAGIRIVTGAQREAVNLTRFCTAEPDAYTDTAYFGINVDQGTSPTVVVYGQVLATSYTIAGVLTTSVPYTTNQSGAHTYYNYELGSGSCTFRGASTQGSDLANRSGTYGTTWW